MEGSNHSIVTNHSPTYIFLVAGEHPQQLKRCPSSSYCSPIILAIFRGVGNRRTLRTTACIANTQLFRVYKALRRSNLLVHFPKCILYRMFYVAEISSTQAKSNNINDHYEQLIHNLTKSHLGAAISGLLLLYPSHIIHIIESSSEILYAILQDLVQIQEQGTSSILQNSKILVISSKIPERLLPRWYSHTVRFPTVYLEDTSDGQPELNLLEDSLTLLLRLVAFVSDSITPGTKGPGQHLPTLAPELLLREAVVHKLIKTSEFLTPQIFLEMYDSPLNISSASGMG
ncbi:testis-expressed protein 47-like [Bombina bombina]|uniref:testis-expressed protein 47-like n=1 Tax=Bombina bombina TaxID=8345 RepID=UPI00235AC7D9|nr:testis-expressed protein 47-like [Bombina bombina]